MKDSSWKVLLSLLLLLVVFSLWMAAPLFSLTSAQRVLLHSWLLLCISLLLSVTLPVVFLIYFLPRLQLRTVRADWNGSNNALKTQPNPHKVEFPKF